MVSKKILFVIAVIAAIALFSEQATANCSRQRRYRFGKGDVGFPKACRGIFGHFGKRYKHLSSRFGGLVNIGTPKHLDDCISAFFKISFGFFDVLDISLNIPGFGPILGKMIYVPMKYILCGLGKNNCAICRETQFGVSDISGEFRVVLKRYELDNCKARCLDLIKKHSKDGGLGSDKGYKRQIVDIVIRISELLDGCVDGNPNKEVMTECIVLVCQIWVIMGNTSSKGTGSDIAGGYLTVVSQYLRDAGYPDITPAQEETITKCAENTDNEAPDADTAPWIKGDDEAGSTDTNNGSEGDSNENKNNNNDNKNEAPDDGTAPLIKGNDGAGKTDTNNGSEGDSNEDKNNKNDNNNEAPDAGTAPLIKVDDGAGNTDTNNGSVGDSNNKDTNNDNNNDNNKGNNKGNNQGNNKGNSKGNNKGCNKGNNKGKKTRRHRRKGLKKDIGADGLTKCSGKLFGRIKNHGKLKKSTACDKAANLKQPNNMGDFLDMSITIIQACGEIFNGFIPGLGDFIVKIVIIIVKICNCLLGSGKYPVCKTDYGYGIVEYANLKPIDLIKKANLEHCQAYFDTMISNASKGKGFQGPQKKVIDIVQIIIDLLQNVRKNTFEKLMIQVSVIGGILGNTYAPTDDGVDFASGFLNTCGTYMSKEGYTDFTPADKMHVTKIINCTVTETTVCTWTVEIPLDDVEIIYE